MTKLQIRGYEVEIWKTRNGDEVFISKGDTPIYSAKVHRGDALNRARTVISRMRDAA